MLLAGATLIYAEFGQAARHYKDANVPPDLIPIIQKEQAVKMCAEQGVPFEKMGARYRWLHLNPMQPPALLVQGGECLAGNDNGEIFVYARFGEGWRKILDCEGDTGLALERASSRTNSWCDLVLWQHDNAVRSARQLSRSTGP